MVESGDRDTPGTLPRDTPFAAVLNKVLQSRLASLRNEFDIFKGSKGTVADVCNISKPLFSSPNNDGLLGTPVVGVLVVVAVLSKKLASRFNVFQDCSVAFSEDRLSSQASRVMGHGLFRKLAVVVDGRKDLDTARETSLVVVHTVTRRTVNQSRTRIRCDKGSSDNGLSLGIGALEQRSIRSLISQLRPKN